LIVVTDRNVKIDKQLKMFVIGTDYKDWERILKDPG
jgi:hypothetical protein